MAAVAGMHDTMTPTAVSKMLCRLSVICARHDRTEDLRNNIERDNGPCVVFAIALIKPVFDT